MAQPHISLERRTNYIADLPVDGSTATHGQKVGGAQVGGLLRLVEVGAYCRKECCNDRLPQQVSEAI